ncbi:MAG TPA: hypothetical protein VGL66_16210 [Caulobacteraceae bacterium]|jgi:hypothetical protein
MPKVRSPNYPSIPLGAALEGMRPVFTNEHRNKMSRSVLAKHMGYGSLNGRALAKIGAVRAYGLIEGSGDELRISDDAILALNAPAESAEGQTALSRMALRPTLFQELRKDFPDTLPSIENLKFTLIKRGFVPDGAEKAAKNYLSTMNLVAGVPDPFNPPDEEEEAPGGAAEEPKNHKDPKGSKGQEFRNPPSGDKVKLMPGERELTSGLLSKGANFRLIVSGQIGVKEIERLISKLEIDKEILAEPDEAEDDLADLYKDKPNAGQF